MSPYSWNSLLSFRVFYNSWQWPKGQSSLNIKILFYLPNVCMHECMYHTCVCRMNVQMVKSKLKRSIIPVESWLLAFPFRSIFALVHSVLDTIICEPITWIINDAKTLLIDGPHYKTSLLKERFSSLVYIHPSARLMLRASMLQDCWQ